MKKRTNRKRKLKRNNKRKTRKFSKKYNSRGGSLFWTTNSGNKLSKRPTPIVMEPTNYGYNLS